MITTYEMIGRILIGAILGGIIGFERDIHRRSVGFRTHLLVAMASATFMVVSNHFVFFQNYQVGTEADVSRIAASVVSGIGFLAAGSILKTGTSVQGLTTAAALWLVTAIGLAAGGGMYAVAGSVTLMGLLSLTILRFFEDKDDQVIRRFVSLVISDSHMSVRLLLDSLTERGIRIVDVDYERRNIEGKVQLKFEALIPKTIGVSEFITSLEKEEKIEQIQVKVHQG